MIRRLSIIPVCALVMLALPVNRAEAAPIVFDFSVNFYYGVLYGQSFGGTLSVEGADCTGIGGACEGVFVPGGAGPAGNLLSLDITIDGVAFSLADSFSPLSVFFDNDTPAFIEALLTEDTFTRLELLATSAVFVAPGDYGLATVTFEGRPTPMPEPASLALLGLGFASAGIMRLRQRRRA